MYCMLRCSLGWRPSLLGGRPSLLGWRLSLLVSKPVVLVSSKDTSLLKKEKDDDVVAPKKKTKQELEEDKAALQAHTDCKSSDMQRVYTIAQAFPLKTSTGKRSAAMVPDRITCAFCHGFILGSSEDKEFYACKRCWEIGMKIAVCCDCNNDRSSRSRPNHDRQKASLMIPTAKSGAPTASLFFWKRSFVHMTFTEFHMPTN